jgi:hypothetical protein
MNGRFLFQSRSSRNRRIAAETPNSKFQIQRNSTEGSVPEMADASENHGHVALVGRGNHFFIAN